LITLSEVLTSAL